MCQRGHTPSKPWPGLPEAVLAAVAGAPEAVTLLRGQSMQCEHKIQFHVKWDSLAMEQTCIAHLGLDDLHEAMLVRATTCTKRACCICCSSGVGAQQRTASTNV
jgi:hypothetical protein